MGKVPIMRGRIRVPRLGSSSTQRLPLLREAISPLRVSEAPSSHEGLGQKNPGGRPTLPTQGMTLPWKAVQGGPLSSLSL